MSARALVVQHEPDAGPEWLAEWLPAAGVELAIWPAYDDPVVPALTEVAGIVVLGGAVGASDDEAAPWLPGVRRLLRAAVAEQVPTFGICLGAQLLAVACGGRVERGGAGPEVGVVPIELTAAASADRVFSGSPAIIPVPQWHFDAVTGLPDGAVVLAGGSPYRNQAFRIGPSAWGVQGHPEVRVETFRAWTAANAELLRGFGIDPDAAIKDVARSVPDVTAVWRRVAAAFAAVVAARERVSGRRR